MEKLLDRLITVIGDEARLFEEFLEALERQQKALIGNDTKELNKITAELQLIVGRSQRLENERSQVVEDIRREGGAGEDVNITEICDMADSARSVQLKSLRETILGLYDHIEETRMRNGLLVDRSLEQIHNTLETIGRIPAQKVTYQKQGSVPRTYAPLGIDRRI